MNQYEMLAVIESADNQAASRRLAALHADNERWENWGQLQRPTALIRETVRIAQHPNWAWGDFEI